MRCPASGSHRNQLRPFFLLPALAVVLSCPHVAGQPFDGPSAPPLEAAPGANLYWHQPGAFWEEGCDQVLHTDCFGYSPRWYALAELQTLRRDNLRSYDFASLGQNGPEVLHKGSLTDESQGGGRVLLGVALSEWYRLEASYCGAFRWHDRAAVWNYNANTEGGIGNLFSPFSYFGNPAVIGLDYNYLAQVGLSSELDEVQLNVRRRLSLPPGRFEASVLVGVRYSRLAEDFSYSTQADVPLPGGAANDVLVRTKNDMTGVQIGLLGQWLVHPRSWIDFEIKGALYNNSADVRSQYVNVDESGLTTSFSGQDSQTNGAGMLDLSLMYNHQFTRALTLRVGYSSLWVGGVALGADNFGHTPNLLLQGPVLLEHDGRLVYHGPSIGLVAAW